MLAHFSAIHPLTEIAQSVVPLSRILTQKQSPACEHQIFEILHTTTQGTSSFGNGSIVIGHLSGEPQGIFKSLAPNIVI